jgi:hypothetical protein
VESVRENRIEAVRIRHHGDEQLAAAAEEPRESSDGA